jgi:small subunit ribosomal protein S4
MGRSTSSLTKVSRRLGVFIGGDLKAFNNRTYPPGQHGQTARRRNSDYSVRLTEKQKLRFLYGGLRETQFRSYFAEAAKTKGNTGKTLLQFLERRLDNVVFRMGLARTRLQARQLVRHSHVAVNGQKVNFPAYRVNAGDEITVLDKSRNLEMIKSAVEERDARAIPEWIHFDAANLKGKIGHLPDDPQLEIPVDVQLVVEFYSR